jgi:hypothetical protein
MITQQWVNIEDDGAMHALLGRLADRVAVSSIDTLWIFPTRRATGIESTVVVIAAFDPQDESRRRVGAVRWLVTRDRKGKATVSEEIHEYARAPIDAVPRVVEGVVRRLGTETAASPREASIEGDAGAWGGLIREFGGTDDPAPATRGSTSDVTVSDESAGNVAGDVVASDDPRANDEIDAGAADPDSNPPADDAAVESLDADDTNFAHTSE